jgi:hypothetical protein
MPGAATGEPGHQIPRDTTLDPQIGGPWLVPSYEPAVGALRRLAPVRRDRSSNSLGPSWAEVESRCPRPHWLMKDLLLPVHEDLIGQV